MYIDFFKFDLDQTLLYDLVKSEYSDLLNPLPKVLYPHLITTIPVPPSTLYDLHKTYDLKVSKRDRSITNPCVLAIHDYVVKGKKDLDLPLFGFTLADQNIHGVNMAIKDVKKLRTPIIGTTSDDFVVKLNLKNLMEYNKEIPRKIASAICITLKTLFDCDLYIVPFLSGCADQFYHHFPQEKETYLTLTDCEVLFLADKLVDLPDMGKAEELEFIKANLPEHLWEVWTPYIMNAPYDVWLEAAKEYHAKHRKGSIPFHRLSPNSKKMAVLATIRHYSRYDVLLEIMEYDTELRNELHRRINTAIGNKYSILFDAAITANRRTFK